MSNASSTARDVPARIEQTWRPIPRSRAYTYVIDQVDEQIVSGALRVGDRLPPERDLATMLGVGRGPVREAIRVLEAYGVVRTDTGPERGTTLTSMPSEALTQILRLHIGLANFPMDDVTEARVMVERWSARLAAKHGSAADLEAIETELRLMEQTCADREAFNEHDTAFHVAIAQASNNRLVADMTTAIRDSIRTLVLDSFHGYPEWPALAKELCDQHREVFDAIAAHDEPGAADAVEAHIRTAYATLGWARQP